MCIKPGQGMNINTASLDAHALSTYAENAHKLQGGGIGSFILNIIPTTSFGALTRNDVLQVLFFAIIFGLSAALVGEAAQPVTALIDTVSKILFRAVGLIVRIAPLGVPGAVAYTVGQYGVGSLQQLISLVVVFWIAVALFVLVVLGTVMRVATGLSILRFLDLFDAGDGVHRAGNQHPAFLWRSIAGPRHIARDVERCAWRPRFNDRCPGGDAERRPGHSGNHDLNVPLANQVLAGDIVIDLTNEVSPQSLAPNQPT